MSIIHTRIDDRLIHGQVATMWTNQLGVSRIMVVDDKAAGNDMVKISLKMATPNGISLSVLTKDKAAARIKENAYEGQRVLLIVKSPETIIKLIENGVDIKSVNVGNLSFVEGKIKVSSTVAVTKEQVEAFKKLEAMGVELTLQMIPSYPSQNFMNMLSKALK